MKGTIRDRPIGRTAVFGAANRGSSPLPGTMTRTAIILAAGEGSRMKSPLAKPLHEVCGMSMILHVIHSLELITPGATVVVVGHQAERVTAHVEEKAPAWANIRFATQIQQNGTGDAASVGLGAISDLSSAHTVLILAADTPLLQASTIHKLISTHESSGNAATLLTSIASDPTGYGRIVRNSHHNVQAIVEHRDATPDQLALNEINTGIYAFNKDLLQIALGNITTNNSQSEYYLTDVVALLVQDGHTVGAVSAPETETAGVNDPSQLAQAEHTMRARADKAP